METLGDTVNVMLKDMIVRCASDCISVIDMCIADEGKSRQVENVPEGASFVDCSTCFLFRDSERCLDCRDQV